MTKVAVAKKAEIESIAHKKTRSSWLSESIDSDPVNGLSLSQIHRLHISIVVELN